MVSLVAVLSTGKGTWGHVGRLVADGTWDKIFLITNEFGRENFKNEKNAELIVVDSKKGLEELREEIKAGLKGKINDTEVAVNVISGEGKEHMALMAAILQLGMGMRFMALTKDGIKEI
jgi:hypothetical protein